MQIWPRNSTPRGPSSRSWAKAAIKRGGRLKGRFTLAGLKQQHDGKDAPSTWRGPPRPASERSGAGNRITGNTGKSVDDERDSEGPIGVKKRSNGRGAKGPCCCATTRPTREAIGG